MNCPKCSNLLSNDSLICPHCATEFTLEEWTTLQQHAWLLTETAEWKPFDWQNRRRAIAQRYATLRTRWQSPQLADEAVVSAEIPSGATPAVPTPAEAIPSPESPPPRERQSFDQWLFAENTIKTALYSGAFLLILAGLIFVGANWARIPWQGKFAVTLAVTAMMCAGGFALLLRSKTLRIGGIALIAISAGFAPLNPYVLQRYWLDGLQVNENITWLVGSLACLVFYLWLARRTESMLFGLFSAGAVLSSHMALYALFEPEGNVFATLLVLMPLVLLLVAFLLRSARYLFRPMFVIANIIMPLMLLGIWFIWLIERNSAGEGWLDSAWWFIIAFWLGACFYMLIDRTTPSALTRWPLMIALALAGAATVVQFGAPVLVTALLLVVLAQLFLAASALYEPQDEQIRPIITTAFLLAIGATLYAATDERMTLVWVLSADVLLLLTVTLLRRHVFWYTAAIWLAVTPVALYASISAETDAQNATILAVLMALYALAASFIPAGRLGFYTAAILLSVLVVPLAIDDLPVATTIAFVIAALYLGLAWREREFLLNLKPPQLTMLPTLAAIGFIFIGHYLVLAQIEGDSDAAPIVTILLCTLFVAVSLLLRNITAFKRLYEQPLNAAGLVLMAVPLLVAIDGDTWVLAAVAAIAALAVVVRCCIASARLSELCRCRACLARPGRLP